MFHLAEHFLSAGEEITGRAALKHLADKGAARFQDCRGNAERSFEQRHSAQVVRGAMARGGGRHVGQHNIGLPAQRLLPTWAGRVLRRTQGPVLLSA